MDTELQQLASGVVARMRSLEAETAAMKATCEKALAVNAHLSSINRALLDTVAELQAALKAWRS